MNKRQQLTQINTQWQQDDQQWSKEIEHWLHEGRQWAALLYMLEKNIPEHTSALDDHKYAIQRHESTLLRFRCGLDEHCIETCPDHLTETQLDKGYQNLEQTHLQIKHTHNKLKTQFEQQRTMLKQLATRLLAALEE